MKADVLSHVYWIPKCLHGLVIGSIPEAYRAHIYRNILIKKSNERHIFSSFVKQLSNFPVMMQGTTGKNKLFFYPRKYVYVIKCIVYLT